MDLLFHYCSTAAFQSMLSTRSIWLSALSQSNDFMEGKLVAAVFKTLAQADALDESTTKRLLDSIEFLEVLVDGLGFCLSEDGDLLSQWRGYADDAHGVSIGFSRAYLEWLAKESGGPEKAGFRLQRVEYEPSKHTEMLRPTYQEVKELAVAGAFRTSGRRGLLDSRTDAQVAEDDKELLQLTNRASMMMLMLFPSLFLLKSPAFKEEREWRLLSHFVRGIEDDAVYRAKKDRLIPYKIFDLRQGPLNSVVEVILGPKHATPIGVVQDMLRQFGFIDTKVSKSKATYR